MARAICTQCGTTVRWRATRGSRLADLSCPDCGGRLRSTSCTKSSRGTRKQCVICGQIRYKHYREAPEDKLLCVKRFNPDQGNVRNGVCYAKPYIKEIAIRKGDPLCWHMHETETGWQP